MKVFSAPKLAAVFAVTLVASAAFVAGVNCARAEGESAFFPTWKLLSQQEKQHFISGYIQGWKDAGRVTDIAVGYVQENPKNVVETLRRIQSLYDLSELNPDGLVKRIDEFYSKTENQSSSLSVAVTSAKSR